MTLTSGWLELIMLWAESTVIFLLHDSELRATTTRTTDQLTNYPYGPTIHPNNALLSSTKVGVDCSCTSQLNLSTMLSWYNVIHAIG